MEKGKHVVIRVLPSPVFVLRMLHFTARCRCCIHLLLLRHPINISYYSMHLLCCLVALLFNVFIIFIYYMFNVDRSLHHLHVNCAMTQVDEHPAIFSVYLSYRF